MPVCNAIRTDTINLAYVGFTKETVVNNQTCLSGGALLIPLPYSLPPKESSPLRQLAQGAAFLFCFEGS